MDNGISNSFGKIVTAEGVKDSAEILNAALEQMDSSPEQTITPAEQTNMAQEGSALDPRPDGTFASLGHRAIFSPENTPNMPEQTEPAFEIVPTEPEMARTTEINPANTPDTPNGTIKKPLPFNPDDIHPNRYDISRETVAAVDDLKRETSPSDLLESLSAMRDLYNAADEKQEGYDSYIRGRR